MSFIKDPINYAYFNVKVVAKKAKLLQFGDYDRLIKTSNVEEIARNLSNTTYGEIGLTQKLIEQKEPITSQEIDGLMTDDFQKHIIDLTKHLPRIAQKFAYKFCKKFYYDSLKVIIRSKHLNLEKKEFKSYVRSPNIEEMDTLNRLMDYNNLTQIIDVIPEWKIRKILLEAIPIYEQTNTSTVLEQAINIGYYSEIWKEAASLGVQALPALRLIGTEIDLINIETILRSKLMGMERESIQRWLIPIKYRIGSFDLYLSAKPLDIINILYNSNYRDFANRVQEIIESGDELNLSLYEQAMKQYVIHQAIKAFRGITFNLGTFYAYFILKRVEFENVRAIIIGKISNLSQDAIKDMIQIW
ncbi:MAG: V-type ATP synthase subunit C [Candidatus Heimdallarchaeota archaeon LC_3]|nr:MAG: V-type ATP synthase subunit C [Candidatus Heimdallarchaeota archaeon LC_3]